MSCKTRTKMLLMVFIVCNSMMKLYAINCYVCDVHNCEPGTESVCGLNQVCMNEVRDENSLFTVRKQCKEVDSCASLEAQNPSQCHRNSETNSLCHYCCDTDLCNNGDYIESTTEAQPVTLTVTKTSTLAHTTEPTTSKTQPSAEASTTVDILPSSSNQNDTPCDSAWKPMGSYFTLAERGSTIQEDYLLATMATSNPLMCALFCLRENGCGLFAFNQMNHKCSTGSGVYELSKLTNLEGSFVYKKD